MIIKNGQVFGEDGSFEVRDIYIEEHRIVSSPEEVTDQTIIDASGLKVIPGLVDIHSHGAFGHDFSDADVEGLNVILEYEKAHGITSYCPTSMTLSAEELKAIFETASKAEVSEKAAVIRGINMEGPFLDPEKKGAHVEKWIRKPDAEFFRTCQTYAGGMIKLVTLAPNIEGAMAFIDELKDEVVVSLGHTGADYDTAKEAMAHGAWHITHLYNAMNPLSHRAPGMIAAAADDKQCMVELIGDGIHIHESIIRNTFRMFGKERVVLISDSMMATGMANGTYELGGQQVTMKDRKATLASGTIAGSATNLFDCMKQVVSCGIPVEDAIFAATRNPARSIGIDGIVGSISPGKEADLLLIDEQLELIRVI